MEEVPFSELHWNVSHLLVKQVRYALHNLIVESENGEQSATYTVTLSRTGEILFTGRVTDEEHEALKRLQNAILMSRLKANQ